MLLIAINLSRYAQAVELDLKLYEGWEPLEFWGNVKFPRAGKLPYLPTLVPLE